LQVISFEKLNYSTTSGTILCISIVFISINRQRENYEKMKIYLSSLEGASERKEACEIQNAS
jgi:hypothetical protein